MKIRTKVFIFFCVMPLIIIAPIAYFFYRQMVNTNFETTRQHLISTAKSAALLVDIDLHNAVIENRDMNSVEYNTIRKKLLAFVDCYEDITEIYTMIRTDDENIFKFIVDAVHKDEIEEDPPAPIGYEYDVSDLPEMKNAFNKADADRNINTDRWGTWLSGYAPILNEEGEPVAIIGIDISVEEILKQNKSIKNQLLLILFIAVVIILLSAFFITKYFTEIIVKFVDSTKMISQGDYDCKMELKTGDEFEILSNSFNEMCKEIKISKDKLNDFNMMLKNTISEKTNSIKTLLDNAGQGFLSFDKSKIIKDEYSAECVKIFGKKIDNLYFPDLIYINDSEKKSFTDNLLDKIFNETETNKIEMYISLLPSELTISDKKIKFEYKIINQLSQTTLKNNSIMVILTDVTNERFLEEKMQNEQKRLKMLVNVIVNYREFLETVNDFKKYYKYEIYRIVDFDPDMSNIYTEVFIKTHTFKGILNKFATSNSIKMLQEYETIILDHSKKNDFKTKNELKDFFKKYEILLFNSFEKDLSILKETFGVDFLKDGKSITVDKNKIIDIENKLISYLSPVECRYILPYIRQLRYKSVDYYISMHFDYIQRLSDNLEKSVNCVFTNSEDLVVDPDVYETFFKSLVHVFRNSLYHGIETVDERKKLNKNETATIKCSVSKDNDNIVMTVSDDGKGLDLNALKEKLIKMDLYNTSMDDQEILQSVFIEGFSTENKENEISGRGIGLSAVKKELDKLCGTVDIKSELNKGTTFTFSIPVIENLDNLIVKSENVIEPLVFNSVKYFKKEMNISVKNQNVIECLDNKIHLRKLVAVINLKGIVQGSIVISLDDNLSKLLVENIIQDEIKTNEKEKLTEISILESLNIIVGNSLKSFSMRDMVTIDTPYSLFSENITLTYVDADISVREIDTEAGSFIIGVVIKR